LGRRVIRSYRIILIIRSIKYYSIRLGIRNPETVGVVFLSAGKFRNLETAYASLVMSHAMSEPITATHCIIFGDAHHVKGDWAKALSYYQKLESISEADLDNIERLGMAYGNAGMIYSKLGELCKATEYTPSFARPQSTRRRLWRLQRGLRTG